MDVGAFESLAKPSLEEIFAREALNPLGSPPWSVAVEEALLIVELLDEAVEDMFVG